MDGMPNLIVKGQVYDAASKKPIVYATIYLKHLRDSTYSTGGLANDSGTFVIENLKPGKYQRKVSFIGFVSKIDTIMINPQNPVLSLPVDYLKVDSKNLNEVEIIEDKPEFELAIDKKIFNVGANSIVAGGSALDALRQVPTVNVDVDGKISLRGSESLVVFINGKPSGLTTDNRAQILQQIPASNIEKIELITNPSAKYDAEGMSGIINIVTKKQIANGKSGSIQVGIGTFHKYNLSGTYNTRKNNFSMTHTLGFRANRYWNEGYNLRTNTPSFASDNTINQYSAGYNWSFSPTMSGNFDWSLKKENNISINYLLNYSNRTNVDSLEYYFLDSSLFWTGQTKRFSEENENSFNGDVGVSYGKKFAKKRELTASTNLNFNYNIEDNNYDQYIKNSQGVIDTNYNPFLQHNNRLYNSYVWVSQIDYVHPFKENYKFETGVKVTYRDIMEDLDADSFNYALNRIQIDSSITNKFNYRELVPAVYGTFTASYKKWGFQVGLRSELTSSSGVQEVGNNSFTKLYIGIFPSAFISYKISDVHQLQLAYSRRINRPGMGQLNPFADYDDPFNLRIGNPDLNPETIESGELTYSMNLKNHNIIATGYFRYVNGVIQRYRYLDTNNVAIVTFLNLNSSMNLGGELVIRNKWTKWWSMNTNFNIFRNQLNGTSPTGNLEATNFSFGLRNNQNFKLGKVSELQLSLNYMAPTTFPQGRVAENWNIDAAIKFDLFKNKANLTFNITDIFMTRRFLVDSQDPNFFGNVYRRRESRIFTVQFTWKFGQQDPDKKPRRTRDQGGSMGGEDGGF